MVTDGYLEEEWHRIAESLNIFNIEITEFHNFQHLELPSLLMNLWIIEYYNIWTFE